MTLETQIPRATIVGNGSLGPYSLVDATSQPIRFTSTSHVKLTRYASTTAETGTLLVLDTDYTVGGTQDARTFTLIGSQAVLTSSQRIVAERSQTYSQDLSLTTGGGWNAESVMARLDKHSEELQELKVLTGRAVVASPLDSTPSTFPLKANASTGNFLGFDADKNLVPLAQADLAVSAVNASWLSTLLAALGSGWSAILGATVGSGWAAALAGVAPSFKIKATANFTQHANYTTGNDTTGTGSALLPYRTRQKAYDNIKDNYDLAGQYTCTTQLAGGPFLDVLDTDGDIDGQDRVEQMIFQGDISNPATVVIKGVNGAPAHYSQNADAKVLIRHVTIGDPVVLPSCAFQAEAGVFKYDNVIFSDVADAHMRVNGGFAQITLYGSKAYQITGDGDYHAAAEGAGGIHLNGGAVTLTGTPDFSETFAQADNGGRIEAYSTTFSGSATGTRARAISGGVIAHTNTLPGDAAVENLGGFAFQDVGTSDPYTPAFTAPTRQTFASGSGTYTRPTRCSRIEVRMVGGGGGSCGSGTGSPGAGGAGGDTTFSTLTAGGGAAGTQSGTPAAGGTATNGDINLAGGRGGGADGAGGAGPPGGDGSRFGGGGPHCGANAAANAGQTNTGGGAGGAGTNAGTVNGGGGGGGGYVEKRILLPSATYAYAVGAGGTGGAAGTSGQAGAAGGSGFIVVDEYYD